MTDTVRIDTAGAVTTIRLDRPAKKNALDAPMYRAFIDGLAAADASPEVRAVIVTGGPDCFTAGNDLTDFLRVRETGDEPAASGLLRALVGFGKPMVAAVAGVAVGIGTTLLLHCDFAIAAPSARFRTPFTDLGLVPEAASSVLLPELIGPRRAARMLYLGEELDAARALEWGLVDEVVADPLARAGELAAALAARPPNAMRKTKALLKARHGADVASAMAAEGEAFLAQLRSDEARDAMMAILARRK